jgi:hypothetical protein
MKYLDSFSSLIPTLQGNRAIKKVEKLRDTGEIQSEQEYNEKLSELLENVAGETYTPSFRYSPLQPGLSSSDQYNEMLEQVRDDLEVAFTEINHIYNTIQAHNRVFRDKAVSDIYASLEQLEKEVDKLSVIANAGNEFQDVELNTFAGDALMITNIERFASEALYDRREDVPIQQEDRAFVDLDEEVLALPLASSTVINFSELTLVGTQTTGTDFDVQLQDSSIDNAIDGDTSSGWVYNILKRDVLSDGAKLVIDADLGDKRLVNYLLIRPISDFPTVLDEITYLDENNREQVLPDSTYFGTALTSAVRIAFDDIVVKKFRLRFSQRSSSLFNYNSSVGNITLDDLRRDTSLEVNAQVLRDEISEGIQNPDVTSVVPVSEPPEVEYTVTYQYTFGFTEITTGLTGFKDKGYFVTKPYKKPTPGLLALEVQENNVEYFDEVAQTVAKVGSFEYSVLKKDFNSRDELLSTKEFPILPISTQSVQNERLLFSGTVKTVNLRFIGHDLSGSGASVEVYRNNTLLQRGVDWQFTDRNNVLDLSDSTVNPTVNETRITILNSDDVIRNGIYTCNYDPRHIAEPNAVITYKGVVYTNSNTTEHEAEFSGEGISYSLLFLKVVIRNNSFYNNKSPKLDFYRVLTSSVGEGRFVRL